MQGRGGSGIRTYTVTEKTGPVVTAAPAADGYDLLLINDAGVIIRLEMEEVPIQGRTARGVRLMRSSEGTVADVAILEREDEDAEQDESDQDLAPGEHDIDLDSDGFTDVTPEEEDLARDLLDALEEDEDEEEGVDR